MSLSEKVTFLYIKSPSEISEKVICKICGNYIEDRSGLVLLDSEQKVINGMCFKCNEETYVANPNYEPFQQ